MDDVLEILQDYMEREGTPPLLLLEDAPLPEYLGLVISISIMEEENDSTDH